MCRVLNKHHDQIPADAVYIGRPSKWGNPFVIGRDGDREQVMQKYCNWIVTQTGLIRDAQRELVGKDLVCYCSPQEYHGDILLAIANAEFIEL
jgi:hypothetical protein